MLNYQGVLYMEVSWNGKKKQIRRHKAETPSLDSGPSVYNLGFMVDTLW